MRVLALNAALYTEEVADVLAMSGASVSAVVSLSPADACSVAAQLGLRYAVQCWEEPAAGKAVFWKHSIPLQGLYRAEFAARDTPGSSGRGLLRVTLLWNGRPLHVVCSQFSPQSHEADWQLIQAARELDGVQGSGAFVLDPGSARVPALPGYVDVWDAAQWRSIAFAQSHDLGGAVRSAFGVEPQEHHTADLLTPPACAAMRLFASHDLDVRCAACNVADTQTRAFLYADLAVAEDQAPHASGDSAFSRFELVGRSGPYPR